jgi:O-antigen/teichoic acid export membrane protein
VAAQEQPGGTSTATPAAFVAASQVFNGIVALFYLKIVESNVGPAGFGSVNAMIAAMFVLGSGLFQPFEQEMSRRVAERVALGEGTGPQVRSAAAVFGGCVAVLLAIVVALGPVLSARVFPGEPGVYGALLVGVVAFAGTHFARGVLAGAGRLPAYGIWFLIEGTVKIFAALTLGMVGVTSSWAYALAAGMAALMAGVVAAVSAVAYFRGDGPEMDPAGVRSTLGGLVASSLLLALLINGAPIAVKVLAGSESKEAAARFIAGLVLVRAPLNLILTAQAVLLPRFSAQVVRCRFSELRHDLSRLGLALAAATAAATAGATLLGPWAIQLLLGPEFVELKRIDFAVLAASSFVLIGAMVASQALIALGGFSKLWTGWAAGVIAMVVGCLMPISLFHRVELGLMLSSVCSACVIAVHTQGALSTRERSGQTM